MKKWYFIENYPNYRVSIDGKVFNVKTNKILKPRPNKTGYLRVQLYNKGSKKEFYIHRLVAFYFVKNPLKKETVNHIDGNKQNNKASNLEWLTKGENNSHAYRIGLMDKKGTKCNFAKLTDKKVQEIRNRLKKGERSCDLANEYKVSRACISKIKTYKTWRHLK